MIATPKTTAFPLLAISGIVLLTLILGQASRSLLNSENTAFSSDQSSLVAVTPQKNIVSSKALQPVLKQGLQPVFQPNQGQFDSRVRYAAMGNGYQAYLLQDQLSIVRANDEQMQVTGIRFLNANPAAQMSASEQGSEVHHYYTAGQTVENVPTFGQVEYVSLYRGIDVVFYSHQGQMEYDFKLQPGADPEQISLEFTGINHASINANGDLRLTTDLGVLTQHAPVSYQIVDGKRITVESRYRISQIDNKLLVNIELGRYRTDLSLVIDPILDYGTFLGGMGNDSANAVAIYKDTVNNRTVAYITGDTVSTTFPGVAGVDTIAPVNKDFYVAAIDTNAASGSQMLFVTHVGGNGNDIPHDIVADSIGDVYVTGETSSTNLNTSNGAYQITNNGTIDGFVLKLNAGSAGSIAYLSYFGGNDDEIAYGIDILEVKDANGNIVSINPYIAGMTKTDNTPAILGARTPFPTASTTPANMNVVSFSSAANPDPKKFIQDANSTATIFDGSDFPGGCSQGFVAKFNATATALIYSSYIGGEGQGNLSNSQCSGNEVDDVVFDIAVDDIGRAHLVGKTVSPNQFPVTVGAYDTWCGKAIGNIGEDISTCNFNAATPEDSNDAFLSRISADGSTLEYSTYIGGNKADVAYALDVKDNGTMVFITGSTRSFDDPTTQFNETFPVSNTPHLAAQGQLNGLNGNSSNTPLSDAFLTVIEPNGTGASDLFYSSYLGGSASDLTDAGRAVVYDQGTPAGAEQVYIAGETDGIIKVGSSVQGLPATNGATDGFIAQFDINGNASQPFSALVGGRDADPLGGGEINTVSIDLVKDMAIDKAGHIYLVGSTQSEAIINTNVVPNVFNGFPVTVGAIQTECGDPTSAPVNRLDDCNAAVPITDGFLVKLVPEADLALSLTRPAVTDVVNATAPFTYTFDVTNNGPETARNVILTATISGTSSVPGTPFTYAFINGNQVTVNGKALGCTQAMTGTVVCTAADIPSGSTTQVSFQLAVDAVGSITVNATVETSSTDLVPTNDSLLTPQTNTVSTSSLFDAIIEMVPDKAQYIGGENITYAVTVTNNGPSNSGGLKVNFPLTPDNLIGFDITNVGSFITSTNALAGNCTEAIQGTGIFCTITNLQNGESATWDLTIQARPVDETANYDIGGATVTETSSSTGRESNVNNNSVSPQVIVKAGADLFLDVNVQNLSGNRFRYDMTLRNLGPAPAQNIVLAAVFPNSLNNPSPQAAGADCSAAPHGSVLAPSGVAFVKCTFTDILGGPLTSGSSFTWSIGIDGVAGSSGSAPVTFSFTAVTADPDNTNNIITAFVNLGGGGFSDNRGGGSIDLFGLGLLVVFVFFARMRMMTFSMPRRQKIH